MAEPEQPKREGEKERRRRFRFLPVGSRVDDPEELRGWQAIRFRLALAARKYPVQIALVVALLIASYPVWLLVDAANDLKAAQTDLRNAVVSTNASRKASSQAYCGAIRANTESLNAQIDFLIGTVRDSAEEEPRTQTEKQATEDFLSGFATLKVVPLDCEKFRRQVEADTKKLQATGG